MSETKNNDIKFNVLHLPPENTNSVLVTHGDNCIIFDPWGKVDDWKNILQKHGLNLRAIYVTHGHPDHISAAPELAEYFNIDWFLNKNDNPFVGTPMTNDFLDMFGLPRIKENYKKPVGISRGTTEILPDVQMEIIESPGHTPGGCMFYFPKQNILLIGDTLFQESIGRYDMPGGDKIKLFESISNLYNMNLNDETYVIHGHGMDTTIGWLKQKNPWFKSE